MSSIPFRNLPYMGVIYVVVEAMKLGYSPFDPNWSNLGQGQPEVGELEGAPPRYDTIRLQPSDHAYGPVEGILELRARVAEHYNRLYRRGLPSQYSAENVVIASGGRTTLTRAIAALDRINLGYFIPDYTAYEDMLTSFERVKPILIALNADEGFATDPSKVRERIRKDGLKALLLSNPCNPTGRVINGRELHDWVTLSRSENCALLLDEYYSHYIWEARPETLTKSVSAAAFVEDVDKDKVILFDGLTKNFRYPGWRVGWAVGPKHLVSKITAAGSFVDGGPPRPMQRAALEVLEPERADQETEAMRHAFKQKRDRMRDMLSAMGITFPCQPASTFYCFGSIATLPAPLNNGMQFFREALKYKVLTVPGEFFDVNPHKLRTGPSPLESFVRFSFGPPMNIMVQGLERLKTMMRCNRSRG